jgi:hypothetical protein
MNEKTNRKSNAKYLWVTAAFVLLASLLLWYLYKSRSQPAAVVNRLLTEPRARDLDRAYSAYSTFQQKRDSKESFQFILNPYSVLKTAKGLTILRQEISGRSATLLVKIQSTGRADQTIFIDLIQENGHLKIDDFRGADWRLVPSSPRIKHAVKGPPFLLLFIASAILFIGGLCYSLLSKTRSNKWIFTNNVGALVFSSCYGFYLQSWWAFFAALLYSLAFCFFVLVWSDELQATRSTIEDVEKLEGQGRFPDLRAVLEKSQNAETKEAALNALMRILSELSSSNQSESRSRAVTWAELIGHPRALEILRKLSDDSDPEIKKRALEVSGNIQKDGNVRKKRDRPGRRLVSKLAGTLAILLPLFVTFTTIPYEDFGAMQLFVYLPLISLVIYWASVFVFYYVPLGILTALAFVLSLPEQMRAANRRISWKYCSGRSNA